MPKEDLYREVVRQDMGSEHAAARDALNFLIEHLGSCKQAAEFLRVDPKMVERNLKRARLTRRMLTAIERRLQVIPRRRGANPLERMAWQVEDSARLNKEWRERVSRLEVEVTDLKIQVELLRHAR